MGELRFQRARIRRLLHQPLSIGQGEGTVRSELDVDPAASVLFELGWVVVLSELPLDRALTTLNQIVGLGLLPGSR